MILSVILFVFSEMNALVIRFYGKESHKRLESFLVVAGCVFENKGSEELFIELKYIISSVAELSSLTCNRRNK